MLHDPQKDVAKVTIGPPRVDGYTEIMITNKCGDVTVCLLYTETIKHLMAEFWHAEKIRLRDN